MTTALPTMLHCCVKTSEAQLKAKEALRRGLGDDYVVALNLAPTTPEWLQKIGAKPMKLGLDLRGGVHFLLEVDMDKAISANVWKLQPPIYAVNCVTTS